MKKQFTKLALMAALLVGQQVNVKAQQETSAPPKPKTPTLDFSKGLGITTPDSTFSVNFRFRMQNRAQIATKSEDDFSVDEVDARVRRLRWRIDGFVFSPKLTYNLQLSFARGDMDFDVRDNSEINSSPNVVRDAVITYKPTHSLSLLFGQTKLPGNRQRVVSSGELQFVDRSIVNATFNVDRDFGFQAHYIDHIPSTKIYYAVKGALTTGEGRNAYVAKSATLNDVGFSYTGRAELLPFGQFANKGDYFEGDLEREQTPKLSLAGGYNYNENALRTGGQLGKDLFGSRDIETYIYDALFKYKGLALYGEYMERQANDPITRESSLPTAKTQTITNGYGVLYQGSYIFKNNYEIAARYAMVKPNKEVESKVKQTEHYTLGVNKYLRKHRVKLQGNLTYQIVNDLAKSTENRNWIMAFQMEFGI